MTLGEVVTEAEKLRREHGNGAAAVAEGRALTCESEGDIRGASDWRRVILVVRELERQSAR